MTFLKELRETSDLSDLETLIRVVFNHGQPKDLTASECLVALASNPALPTNRALQIFEESRFALGDDHHDLKRRVLRKLATNPNLDPSLIGKLARLGFPQVWRNPSFELYTLMAPNLDWVVIRDDKDHRDRWEPPCLERGFTPAPLAVISSVVSRPYFFSYAWTDVYVAWYETRDLPGDLKRQVYFKISHLSKFKGRGPLNP